MTRENKLALVVGFGLLLFVGILVSDHFSAAHRQDSAAFGVASTGERSARSISIAPMPAAGVASLQPLQPQVASSDVRPASAVTPIPSMPMPARVEPTVTPVVTATAETRKPSAKQESEPGVKLHPIADGETLYAICKREYGDGSLSTALAKYNRKAIPDPNRMRKGVTIRIPPVEVLRPGSGKGRPQESAEASTPAPAPTVEALAAAEMVAIDSRTPIGGEVRVEVEPQAAVKPVAPKAAAKPAPKQPAKKPAKKPVAAKPASR